MTSTTGNLTEAELAGRLAALTDDLGAAKAEHRRIALAREIGDATDEDVATARSNEAALEGRIESIKLAVAEYRVSRHRETDTAKLEKRRIARASVLEHAEAARQAFDQLMQSIADLKEPLVAYIEATSAVCAAGGGALRDPEIGRTLRDHSRERRFIGNAVLDALKPLEVTEIRRMELPGSDALVFKANAIGRILAALLPEDADRSEADGAEHAAAG